MNRLDKKFVLLIIFIIVSASIKVEQGIDLKLPEGGRAEGQIDVQDVGTVSITRKGTYLLGNRQMGLDSIVRELVAQKRVNPSLVVDLRVDETGMSKYHIAAIDKLTQNQFTRFRIRTRAEK